MLALLMVLGSTLTFPSKVSAQGTTTGVAQTTPGISGPLVAACIQSNSRCIPPSNPIIDASDISAYKNYVRLTESAWAFDPLSETDQYNDYYIVFVSAAIQAKGDNPQTCLWDGRLSNFVGPSLRVEISTSTGTILTDKINPISSHGDELATLGYNLGLTLGIGPSGQGGIGASVNAGISWSQIIYAWETKVTSLDSSDVVWETTISHALLANLNCNQDAFVWGYAVAISVGEGQGPVVDVSMTGNFIVKDVCVTSICLPNVGSIDQLPHESFPIKLSLPRAISFETNPLVGSVVLNGTEFAGGQHTFLPAIRPFGIYSAAAVPPEDYIFDHWQVEGGVSLTGQSLRSNPIAVNVTGNGVLRAVFAAKLTFLTDPPNVGSISISGPGGTGCGSGAVGSAFLHSNGDWTYISALPPDPSVGGRDQPQLRVCANTPAGYKFDHWSSTAQFVGVDSPVDPTVVIALSGPSTIEAWFVPQTCCPGVYFATNLFYNGGGSIRIGTQNVTNSQVYYPQGSAVNPLAVPLEGYVFDHWVPSPGLRLDDCCAQTLKSNPAIFDVTGTGSQVLTAHFLPKVTFQTDPAGIGSISWGGCGPDYPGHSGGDWIYAEAFATVTICANTGPGYRFDHWTTTTGVSGSLTTPYNNSTSVTLWMNPVVIKAWFTSLVSPVTPPSAPSAPSSLVAIGQNGDVDLAWNVPLSNGGSPVTGYSVYRGDSFSGLSFLASIGNQLWYQDTSATNGQAYYYRVTAVNPAGEGPSSNTDSARPGIDRITIAPDPRSVLTGAQVQFSAFARAESGEIIQSVSFSWATSVPGASITNAGLFKAGTIIGTFTEEVSASAAGVNGYATVIVQAPPGARASTASLPFDSLGPWTWALIPGAVAVAIGVLGVIMYRKKTNTRLSKQL